MAEFDLITRYFKPLATLHAGSLQLSDDAALIDVPEGHQLVVTKDMLAQGIHFRSSDPPQSVGRKLLAVNLSDLAAMGARPLGCFLGLGLPSGWREDWVQAFAQGVGAASTQYQCPLLGGDTISALAEPVLSLTALGSVPKGLALQRSQARLGNTVFVSGMIGMAGLGLRLLEGENPTHKKPVLELTQQHMQACIARYQCPEPRVALGQMLQGLAQGCVDISDGLLADARHMAKASGVCIEIDLASIPVLPGVDPLQAATWGDDYELLFTLPAQKEAALFTLSQRLGVKITRIGQCIEHQALNDTSLLVVGGDGQRSVPTRLGYEHS